MAQSYGIQRTNRSVFQFLLLQKIGCSVLQILIKADCGSAGSIVCRCDNYVSIQRGIRYGVSPCAAVGVDHFFAGRVFRRF